MFEEELDVAIAPMSVALTLEDDIDVGRGDMIVRPNNTPEAVKDIVVMFCWLGNTPLNLKTRFNLQHTSNKQLAVIKGIIYKINIDTLERLEGNQDLKMNDIAKVKISIARPIMVDTYRKNRNTGCIILVDSITNETVVAGMIV